MRDGFIKVVAATTHVKVADCRYNAGQTIALMEQAAARGARLVVFSELGLTAYTCADLFLQPLLQSEAVDALASVVQASRALNLVGVVGLPLVHRSKLYNCAVVFSGGTILGVVPKSHLPNYGEFYEQRWFSPAPAGLDTMCLAGGEYPFGTKLLFQCRSVADFIFGVEICEDAWVPVPPSSSHTAAGALIVANLSASNEMVGKSRYRRQLVQSHSAACVCAYVYADAGSGESSTDLVFSGHDLIAENGVLLAETTCLDEGMVAADVDVDRLASERLRMSTYPDASVAGYMTVPFDLRVERTRLERIFPRHPFVPADVSDLDERCAEVLRLQASGLKTRLDHTGVSSVVIGISGGLDSTLALLVAVEAFDRLKLARTAIQAVTMPCFGTSERTLANATSLCGLLGVSLRTIDITAAVRRHFSDIGHDEQVHDVVFENSQARERTQVLMDIANANGALVVGTGDLSELALGWATYNGDHMSMYGVNASVPKTLVRHVVSYWARLHAGQPLEAVLKDVLDTPVSPELLPAVEGKISQTTETIVGPYELHDFFLYHTIRSAYRPAKIVRIACASFEGLYDRAVIITWLKVFYRRFFSQQFKRSCMPDGPKVGSVALSPRGDWRMSSDSSVVAWLRELADLQEGADQ